MKLATLNPGKYLLVSLVDANRHGRFTPSEFADSASGLAAPFRKAVKAGASVRCAVSYLSDPENPLR